MERAWAERVLGLRHSVGSPYTGLNDIEEDIARPSRQQNPPPVPPKIPEAPVEQGTPVKGSYLAPSHPWMPAPAKVTPTRREKEGPEKYTKPFTDFMTANPTVFHAVDAVAKDLEKDGYQKLNERDAWDLKAGGKYYVDRNGTSLIAFAIGEKYEAGNGAAIVAGHIDALTAKLKPIPKLRNKAGYMQLGVAPYAGALSNTWWDRDLGIGGRVLVRENGKITTKLVKLDWPIARIPTLAPHFGAAANGPFNRETQMVPIVGLDNSDLGASTEGGEFEASILGGEGAFAATQPERLVKAISGELGITDCLYFQRASDVFVLANRSRLHHCELGARALRRTTGLYWRSRQRVHLRRTYRRQTLQLGRRPGAPQLDPLARFILSNPHSSTFR